jgi:putative ABC transport system substrate-binding protein
MNRRRDFISLLGGAAAWPITAHGQQAAVPVIGYLYVGSPETGAASLDAFRKGLTEVGYVENRNVTIAYRYANNDFKRLPELASDLVSRHVALIAALGTTAAALAAKHATSTIPIIFQNAADPVESGLVQALNRPGGNITGLANMGGNINPKRLGLLHQLLPRATRLAVLRNITTPITERSSLELLPEAPRLGLQMDFLDATNSREIDLAFETVVTKHFDALFVTNNTFFRNRRVQLATRAIRDGVPTSFPDSEFTEVGGLMSYGPNNQDLYRQAGIYAGRILKGERTADLPVMRPSKFDLVINVQTAKLLRIDVPPTLLALADEVIE